MKTAVLLRGLPRNYSRTVSKLQYLYPNSDIFFHSWDIDGRRTVPTKRHSYSQSKINFNKLIELSSPKAFEVSDYNQVVENIKVDVSNFLNLNKISQSLLVGETYDYLVNSLFCQLYSFQRGVKLILEQEKNTQYSEVVISRFDFELTSKRLVSTPNELLASIPMHGSNSCTDFIHILEYSNLIKLSTIYDELLNFTDLDVLRVQKRDYPFFLKTENWYQRFFKDKQFNFNPCLSGNIIR